MEKAPSIPVRCPACKKGACAAIANALACPECGARFLVADGVADLVPELVFKRSVSQAFMESPFIVSIYESRLWRRNPLLVLALGISFDKEAQVITEAARLHGAGAVLDLACGPGIYTRPFARAASGAGVVGLDLSKPMLCLAGKKARAEGLGNLSFLRGNAMDLPFFDGAFDAVNCCGALHLFPDTRKALSEVFRVLAPGGRFTVAAVRRINRVQAALWEKAAGVRSYTKNGLSRLLEQEGFSRVACHHAAGAWLILSAEKGA